MHMSTKEMFENVCHAIHNIPELEATQIPTNGTNKLMWYTHIVG